MSDLEKQILGECSKAVNKAVIDCLTGYSSPLTKMASMVVESHSAELTLMMDTALCETIKAKEFKTAIKSAFTHKLAKTLMSKMEGEVEKATHVIRQDPVRRSKIILAIEKLIGEIE